MKFLIIGAGASGLMAATVLTSNGHNVTIVEARNRIGGRIHTINDLFSLPIEAGAEFMHGQQSATESLMKKSGTKHSLLSGKRYQIWNGERDKGDLFDDDWQRVTEALQRLKADTNMASFLDAHFNGSADERLRKKIRSFVEGFDAADMNRVSAFSLRQEWSESDDEHQYQIEGGYSRLMQFLANEAISNGARLQISTVVTEVRWSKRKVNVVTASGETLESEKVIVTVPLGVLQRGMITFTPSLPRHAEAFNQLGFGGVIKFFVEFKDAFWEDRIAKPLKDLAFVFSDAEIPTWWTHRPHRTPLLTGWLGGPRTQEMPDDRDILIGKAMNSLQYIFQCSAATVEEQTKKWHVENWLVDPFAFGAYAYPTTETQKALAYICTPVENTIYFAGEAMYRGTAIGTVEAALINGQQVANAIVSEHH